MEKVWFAAGKHSINRMRKHYETFMSNPARKDNGG